MNRTFNTIALQSVVAAAILALAPLANAGNAAMTHNPVGSYSERHLDPVTAPGLSSANRADVRQDAIAARNATLGRDVSSQAQFAPTPIVSTVSRAQVRAEAAEAVRLGVNAGYEDERIATPSELAQIRQAGERAARGDMTAAAKQ